MSATTLHWLQHLWGYAREQGARTVSAVLRGGKSKTPWEVVYVAANRMEAEIVRAHLESEDIPVALAGEAVGTVFGLTTGPLAQVQVLVPAPLADRARDLLDVPDQGGDENHSDMAEDMAS